VDGARNRNLGLLCEDSKHPCRCTYFLPLPWDHIRDTLLPAIYNGANKVTFHLRTRTRRIAPRFWRACHILISPSFELLTAKREFAELPRIFRHGPLTVEAFP